MKEKMMTSKAITDAHSAKVFANDLLNGVYINEPLVLNRCASVIIALAQVLLDQEKEIMLLKEGD